MARRGRRKGRRGTRGRRSDTSFTMSIPITAYITEGNKVDLSFTDVFPIATTTYMMGVPWRLKSFTASFTLKPPSPQITPDPAIIQVELNSAGNNNVEAINSLRILVIPYQTITRTLRMKGPNLWKEDEQRKQALITIQNVDTKSEATAASTCFILATVRIQFGKIPFDFKSKIQSVSHLAHSVRLPSAPLDLKGMELSDEPSP